MQKYLWDTFTDTFGRSILHPQYLIKKSSFKAVDKAVIHAHGKLLDIGCGRMPYRKLIEPRVKQYIGLDHPKASKLYTNSQIKPDFLCDARTIPITSKSIDTVLLFEVLEHLPYPTEVLKEVRRIITNKGIVIISVPFMYPLHDLGYDYMRYTEDMHTYMLEESKFRVVKIESYNNFYEFICISIIVFLLYRAKDMKSPFRFILLLIALPIALFFNFLSLPVSWIGSLFPKQINRFPLNYTIVAKPIVRNYRKSK